MIERLLRPDIAALHAYTPILPLDVLAEQLGLPIERLIKVDANENPYGPSPRALAALAEFPYYAIYPDPEQRHLRALLSDYTGQPAARIICGAGADELIDVLIRALVAPGETIINCPPTFGMYAFLGGVQGARVVSVERDEDFAVDIERIAEAAEQHRAKIVFLTQPNNPTGNMMPRRDIERLLELKLLVVVDEAYIEFAEEPKNQEPRTENQASSVKHAQLKTQNSTFKTPNVSVADLLERYSNLVVLRTFSKWAGLAGLRVGYALVHEELIQHMWKIKQPYNVNAAALVAAEASLRDLDYLRGNIARIVAERARLFAGLSAIPWLRPYPSQANFVLCRITSENHEPRTTNQGTVDGAGSLLSVLGSSAPPASALAIKEVLMKQGILVRYYSDRLLRDCIRISVGTPAQNDAVLAALAALGM